MTHVDLEVADSLERIFPVPLVVTDWDDVLERGQVTRRRVDHLRGRGHRRRVLLLAGAALIVAVASASAFGTVRDLLFGQRRTVAFASAPSWSPDGRRIAFVSVACAQGCNGPPEVHVMNADGGGEQNLAHAWGLDADPRLLFEMGFPVWSADWRKVAILRGRADHQYSDIHVMNADGSGRRQLTRSPQNDADPVWSPNGRRLAFVRIQGGRSDVYVVNADGSRLRRLARAIAFKPAPGGPSSGLGANPAWSPDGRKIAFMSNRDGNDDIFVVNADGSGLRNLTPGRANDPERVGWFSFDGPAWSPDGRKIVFESRRNRPTAAEREVCRGHCHRQELYVVDVDGGGLRRLTRNWKDDASPAWSPDGRRILFVRSGFGDVYVMNANGSGQRNLTRSARQPQAAYRAPSWSPDGRKILFVGNPEGNGTSEIYVMNSDGSGKRKLTDLRGEG